MERKVNILFVAHSSGGRFSPYVSELAQSLRSKGLEVEMFGIERKGLTGYLRTLPLLKRRISDHKPDLVHAFYGLSGLLANLQRKYPVVTTYLGSDIHSGGWLLKLSRLCIRLSKMNIFVSCQLMYTALKSRFITGRNVSFNVLSGGVDMDVFFPMDRQQARSRLAASIGKDLFEDGLKYVVFAGSFSNPVKNSELAFEAVKVMNASGDKVRLMEMKGYSRSQVNLLLNSADCLLMTSHREGSPMVIKEAMAAGCPVVSVDVGDVSQVMGKTEGCFIAGRESKDIAADLEEAIKYSQSERPLRLSDPENVPGRRRIVENNYDSASVASLLVSSYDTLLRVLNITSEEL
ncbi:MAG: glycosyltransferase [Bacteroidales bacterium]|nr:glycosyltransferase [Bacteroidales bacterium]